MFPPQVFGFDNRIIIFSEHIKFYIIYQILYALRKYITNEMDSPYLTGFTMCQSGVTKNHLTIGEIQMYVTTVGIDLAKMNFSLVGSDKHQKIVLRQSMTRSTSL